MHSIVISAGFLVRLRRVDCGGCCRARLAPFSWGGEHSLFAAPLSGELYRRV